MAENPLARVARLLGGVAMMQGGLGHQVLGQLMIAGTGELPIAGAAVVVATTLRQRNTAAQLAIRTAAPALAVYTLFARREQLLLRREQDLVAREKAIAAQDFTLKTENRGLRQKNALANAGLDAFSEAMKRARLDRADLKRQHALCVVDRNMFRQRNESFREEIGALKDQLRAIGTPPPSQAAGAPSDITPAPAKRKRAKPRVTKAKRRVTKAKRRNKKRE